MVALLEREARSKKASVLKAAVLQDERTKSRSTAAVNLSPPHPLDMIGKRRLAERLGVNPWTLMRWCDKGLFPSPIRLTEQTVKWRVADVQRWLEQRRDDAETAEALRQRKAPPAKRGRP